MSVPVLRSAPLGARFCDAATGAPVPDGLSVWAEPVKGKGRWPATPGRDGLHVWHTLPGLERWACEDADFTTSRRAWVLRVDDTKQRYLPVALQVEAPLRGLVSRRWGVEKLPRPAVQLARSVAAPPLECYASIHTELWDRVSARPAAWALLSVRAGATGGAAITAWGLADELGQVMVNLPWPEPAPGTHQPLSEASWTVTLRVRYGRLSRNARGCPPTLDAIEAQPSGRIWRTQDAKSAFSSATLYWGRPLVLRGEGARTSNPLVITS